MVATDFPDSGDENLKKYFKPESIKANVILAANPASGKCGEKTGVNQKFSILFKSVDDTTVYQKKSGNPGYLDGLPLKLAS